MSKPLETSVEQPSPLFRRVEQLLGLDLRSLGVFRISIGFMILVDLAVRAGSLTAHYSDAGIVTREALKAYGELPLYLTFYGLSGSVWFQAVLFILTSIAALAFMAGYRTRLATIACWLLMLSLHVRNPFVNNLGDWFLVDVLFWGMFLPLGARYSMDAWHRNKEEPLPNYVLSVATLGMILQIGFLYLFSTYHKIMPEWHTDGTAIAFAMNLDRITTPLGQSLLLLPAELLKVMTFGVLHLERWGPVLLLFPFFNGPIRTLIVVSFIAFHAGLAATVEIGVFPYLCIATWTILLPGWAWTYIDRIWLKLRAMSPAQSIGRLWQQWRSFLQNIDNRKKTPRLSIQPGILDTLLSAFGLWVILSSGLLYTGNMGEEYYEYVYKYVEPLGNSLNLQQRWDMFSPGIPRQDGWFVMNGRQKNGEHVDVFTGNPVSWERPELISATYRNQRWRKNLEWVMRRWDPHARLLAEYLWNDWNCRHTGDERIERLDIVFMTEFTLDNLESTDVERKVLYSLDEEKLRQQHHISRLDLDAGWHGCLQSVQVQSGGE